MGVLCILYSTTKLQHYEPLSKGLCKLNQQIDFDTEFALFRDQLLAIFTLGPSVKVQGIDLYGSCFDICNSSPASNIDKLLHGIIQLLGHVVGDVRTELLARQDIISAYAEKWAQFKKSTSTADYVCASLNRVISKRFRKGGPSVQLAIEGVF